jgi:putative ABC transport system permease protein
MLISYLKIAIRNIILNKSYSVINILGLAIGLSSCFIIYLYVSYQITFDNHNKKIDNTYLVYNERRMVGLSESSTPEILGPTIKNEYPEVMEYARWKKAEVTINYQNKMLDEQEFVFSDPSIFNILTLPIKLGGISVHNPERNAIVVSEKIVSKYFGDKDPIGKTINVSYRQNKYDLKVVAVMKDIPKSSTFTAELIAPLALFENQWKNFISGLETKYKVDFSDWEFGPVNTYVLLSPNCKKEIFEKKLISLTSNSQRANNDKSVYHLLPIKDIYLNSSFISNNDFPQGNIKNVYIYSTVAILILVISLITFLMLSIGRASLRTKEIGIRKVIGANRSDLFKQSVMESLVVTLLSFPFSIMLVEILLPHISNLIGLRIESGFFHNYRYLLTFFIITVLAGITAGSYIALRLSRLNSTELFQNNINLGINRFTFRRIMMAIQFTIVTGLIFATITIYRQLDYFYKKDFGFNKNNLVFFQADNKTLNKNYNAFKNDIKNNASVLAVSGGLNLPGSNSRTTIRIPVKNNPGNLVEMEVINVDRDFIETFEMKMTCGKSFGPMLTKDSASVCLINECAANALNLKSPIGEKLIGVNVIGVVKDFVNHSLHNKITPIIIKNDSEQINEIAVRINPADIKQTIEFIRKKSQQFNNGKPMDYKYYDDRLDENYMEEKRFAKVIWFFTGLTIFVACLGLFGMSLFVINRRIKEIGIRKVLGANIGNIIGLLTKEFANIIISSALIAFPVSFYLVNKWLQNFAYRVNIDMWTFIIACIADVTIVFSTVSFQAIKAAIANPVASLRYE